jgi:ATP-dependent protease ClpP protease subunit
MMISAIKSSKRPVYTVCVELCASMAAITHQYGVRRFMLPYASVMFHEAAYGVQGQLTHNKSREAFYEQSFAKFEVEVAARAGCDIVRFRAQENKEWWLLIDEAGKEHFNDAEYTAGDFPAPKE